MSEIIFAAIARETGWLSPMGVKRVLTEAERFDISEEFVPEGKVVRDGCSGCWGFCRFWESSVQEKELLKIDRKKMVKTKVMMIDRRGFFINIKLFIGDFLRCTDKGCIKFYII